MVHDLKIWPEYFQPVIDGTKTFEYRAFDRDYKVGDILHLREFDMNTATYTGRECYCGVPYILAVPWVGGLKFAVMSIVLIDERDVRL